MSMGNNIGNSVNSGITLTDFKAALNAKGINDEKQWPIGVLDCYVGGSLHRQGKEMKIDESNYMDAIYGGPWDSTFSSISTKGDYDGCELYVSSSNE